MTTGPLAAPRSGFALSPAALVRLLRRDLLVQNSFFITASTALMGVLGFAFWVLCARLFDPAEVGLGSSLVAASPLLSYLGLCGFQAAFVFFIPTADEPDELVSTGVNIVLLASCVIAAAYVALVPLVAPQLAILHESWLTAAVFVLCSAALAGNLLTDSYFIAQRAARFNLLVDGVVQSLLKLALPVVLVGLGAFGIYASTGLAAVAALVLSLVLMHRSFGFRWKAVISRPVLRDTFSFAAGTYVASILNLVPLLVLPVVVLRSQGAAQAGFYYMAFQVSNLVNAVSYAISQSMYAEGSQPGADLRALVVRSARLMAGVLVPVVMVLVFAAPLVVIPFGESYVEAAGPLAVMACRVPGRGRQRVDGHAVAPHPGDDLARRLQRGVRPGHLRRGGVRGRRRDRLGRGRLARGQRRLRRRRRCGPAGTGAAAETLRRHRPRAGGSRRSRRTGRAPRARRPARDGAWSGARREPQCPHGVPLLPARGWRAGALRRGHQRPARCRPRVAGDGGDERPEPLVGVDGGPRRRGRAPAPAPGPTVLDPAGGDVAA